jgi:hypothetical protein
MQIELTVRIEFRSAVNLAEIDKHKVTLGCRGVYLLIEAPIQPIHPDPFSPDVVYIGKAIKETLFSRNRKHLWTVTAATSSNGTPKTAPGEEFKRYRESINHDPSRLWIVPGVMSAEFSYLISCAEEYLLFEYKRRNKRLPKANTAG